jgi:hypothetical protein
MRSQFLLRFLVVLCLSLLIGAQAFARNKKPLNSDVARGAVQASILAQAEQQLQGTGISVRSVDIQRFNMKNTTEVAGVVRLSNGNTEPFTGSVRKAELRRSIESLGWPKNLPKDRQAQHFSSRRQGSRGLYYPRRGPGKVYLPKMKSLSVDLSPGGRIALPLKANEIRLPNVRTARGRDLLVKTSKVNVRTGLMTTTWGRQQRGPKGRFLKGFAKTGKTTYKTAPRAWKGYAKSPAAR